MPSTATPPVQSTPARNSEPPASETRIKTGETCLKQIESAALRPSLGQLVWGKETEAPLADLISAALVPLAQLRASRDRLPIDLLVQVSAELSVLRDSLEGTEVSAVTVRVVAGIEDRCRAGAELCARLLLASPPRFDPAASTMPAPPANDSVFRAPGVPQVYIDSTTEILRLHIETLMVAADTIYDEVTMENQNAEMGCARDRARVAFAESIVVVNALEQRARGEV